MKDQDDFFVRQASEAGVVLNEVQRKAVVHPAGPLLLLASPGSGKTTTIIMRIGYLIKVKGVDPARIKAVTFSRASANDMRERYNRYFPDLGPVQFSTIHSFAFEVVREHLRRQGIAYQIIEGGLEEDADGSEAMPMNKKLILRRLFKSIVRDNVTDDQMDELMTYISYIKNKMIPPEQWPSVKVGVPEAERILREYESFKRSGHNKLLLDYDDMLTIAEQVLEADERLLRRYQQRYDYMLTDESQDTSLVQHAIIGKLVRAHGNLCVVADDDQSIYSWRGAEPSYLLHFRDTYPNAGILYMEQNYRSTKAIVNVANQFIKRNRNRYDKNMFTHNTAGAPIRIRSFANYVYQTKFLVDEIRKIEKLSDIAVLYRNNSSSIALMNAFDRAGIPFYMKDADNRFFSHWVVEDILNFMRMTFTDKRPELLEKIHLKLNGYISKQQMEAVKAIDNQESVFDNLLNYVQLHAYQVKPLFESRETFRQMRGMPPLQAIHVIRERLGYEKAIEKTCERLGFRKEYLIGILNTLEEIADSLATMEEFANRLKHLEQALKTARFRKGDNAVTFSTFHSAKGLEFERVYMIDLVDGIIPSSEDRKGGALTEEAMEEAARLFYVGMTRAKRELELLVYRERDQEKTAESPFVAAVRSIMNPQLGAEEKGKSRAKKKAGGALSRPVLNPNAIRSQSELEVGKEVRHRVFGPGTIFKVDEERVYIRFENQVKVISIELALEMGLLEAIT